jgi:hypothetical protein
MVNSWAHSWAHKLLVRYLGALVQWACNKWHSISPYAPRRAAFLHEGIFFIYIKLFKEKLLCFQNQNIFLIKLKKKKEKSGDIPFLPTNRKTISCKVFSSASSTQQQNTKQTLALILKKINHKNHHYWSPSLTDNRPSMLNPSNPHYNIEIASWFLYWVSDFSMRRSQIGSKLIVDDGGEARKSAPLCFFTERDGATMMR